MAQIAYALAGEGRGHATRARSIANALMEQGHRVVFLAGDDGFDFLSECFDDDSRITIIRIPSLHFAYSKRGKMKKVSIMGTITKVIGFLWDLREEVKNVIQEFKKIDFDPDFFLCDYEPLAWRVARRLKKPLISLDNQHFFAFVRLAELPLHQWPFTFLIGITCFLMVPGKRACLISKFVPEAYIRKKKKVHMVGPLIRPEIQEYARSEEQQDFVLCYLRPSVADHVIDVVQKTGVKAKVYGLGEKEAQGNMTFCATSADEFARDLARAEKVIGTAGNQLIGECLYLRKPLFLVPEPGQMEQQINAYLARRFGAKMARKNLPKRLDAFLKSSEQPEFPFSRDAVDITLQYLSEYIDVMQPPASGS
ncbi:MAG: glycosyltransferase family protein [Candidatus Sumerlaeia bacterium]